MILKIHSEPFIHFDCDQEGIDALLDASTSNLNTFTASIGNLGALSQLFGIPVYLTGCPMQSKALDELVEISEELGLYDWTEKDYHCPTCGRHLPCRHCEG